MNLDKIIKECPKAFRELIHYATPIKNGLEIQISSVRFTASKDIIIEGAFPDGYLFDYSIHFRELYDYFDSVGIKIEVSDKSYESYWVYNVDCYDDGKEFFYEGYDTRTEAEYKAFEKAFEIREQQLKEV